MNNVLLRRYCPETVAKHEEVRSKQEQSNPGQGWDRDGSAISAGEH
jgi:hypothetical protein